MMRHNATKQLQPVAADAFDPKYEITQLSDRDAEALEWLMRVTAPGPDEKEENQEHRADPLSSILFLMSKNICGGWFDVKGKQMRNWLFH